MPFGIEQYERMAIVMRQVKGRAILTVNDHPDMREVFVGLDFERVEIQYTVGVLLFAVKEPGVFGVMAPAKGA